MKVFLVQVKHKEDVYFHTSHVCLHKSKADELALDAKEDSIYPVEDIEVKVVVYYIIEEE